MPRSARPDLPHPCSRLSQITCRISVAHQSTEEMGDLVVLREIFQESLIAGSRFWIGAADSRLRAWTLTWRN
jgi:hypothetical protein